MLDQSIPYKDIVMCRAAGPVGEAKLPPGYAFCMYQPGDERHWARIETSVLEFGTEDKALSYFERVFLPHGEELPERMVFVKDAEDRYVSTATAWYEVIAGKRRAMLHWVATEPGQQGKGIGRAVVTRALGLMETLEPGSDMLLHTQTWSHVAVRLYLKLGFRPLRQGVVGRSKSHFPEARSVLRGVFEPKTFFVFSEEAVSKLP